MRVLPVDGPALAGFLTYCARYGREHDDSYLPDAAFRPGRDNPSFLLTADGQPVGAASLMLEPAFRAIRKGRFRILHCLEDRAEWYRALLAAALAQAEGVDDLYLFLPEERGAVGAILESAGFRISRYSWLLERPTAGLPPARFPAGYAVAPFRAGQDAGTWCDLVNECFAHLAGHTDLTPERLAERLRRGGHPDGGMLILRHGETPVGTVEVTRETDEGGGTVAEIGALGVIPAERGRGLGRNLLRAGVAAGRAAGLATAVLSVNAENRQAADLYLAEGFARAATMICYNLSIRDEEVAP